jgi:hypothetical protein
LDRFDPATLHGEIALERLQPTAEFHAIREPLVVFLSVWIVDDGDKFRGVVVVSCFESERLVFAVEEPQHVAPHRAVAHSSRLNQSGIARLPAEPFDGGDDSMRRTVG